MTTPENTEQALQQALQEIATRTAHASALLNEAFAEHEAIMAHTERVKNLLDAAHHEQQEVAGKMFEVGQLLNQAFGPPKT